MRTARLLAFGTGTAALLAVACAKVPYTNRVQYNLVPNALMTSLGASSYTDALQGERVERKTEDAQTLNEVGRHIAGAADEPDYAWEFSLVDDPTINAWCLPGGYIAFYTGILPVLRNEAGMAFVMGHEVAHATAKHGAERLSQQLTLLGGMAGLELYLSDQTALTPEQRAMLLGALGLGAEVGVLLPFSRTHESEADIIGMMYMAEAGYPPAQSIDVWDRMEAQAPSGVPAFLSTHPSSEKRKANLREWLPRARKKYERNKLPHDTVATKWTGAAPR
jgi:predicted Zn-dependent protease